jgi:cellulose synthase/poly-beta-1,6-N-acetylglucosamine synthase-like glycosyltransferase
VQNCLALDYPVHKLTILFVTDGSDDGSESYLKQWDRLTVLHDPKRAGKIGALNHAMREVKTPFALFCDADTMLNTEAIREMVKHFENPKVGCVAGEKRIDTADVEAASGAGEGIYWKYESQLKKWDYELHSVVGAAGELFGIRTSLFQPVHPAVILDDFIISLRMAKDGYITAYAPEAYATEPPVNRIEHEIRRKIRISSGGIQSIIMLAPLLNPFPNPVLTFQYISHRVLRWTLTPIFLFLLIPLNLILAFTAGGIFLLFCLGQLFFYALAIAGWYYESRKLRLKVLFIPFYFTMMNYTAILGMQKYFSKQTTVLWEKADRG